MAITVINPSVTKILLDLGIDPINPFEPDNAEDTYMSAVREGINTIEAATKGKGDRRSRILREEFQGLLSRRKGKKVVSVSKLLAKKSIIPTSRIRPQALLPPSQGGEEESQDRIGSVLNDILEVLRKDIKLDKREMDDARKERQRQNRIRREKVIESLQSGAGTTARAAMKVVDTLTSPFKDIISRIVNFIKFTVIGVLFNKALNWFGKKENQEKIANLGRFFKDWWPTLLAGFLLFFTPLGGLVSTVAGIITTALPTIVSVLSSPLFLKLAGLGLGVGSMFAIGKMLGMDKVSENLAEEKQTKMNALMNEGMDAGQAEQLSEGTRLRDTSMPGDVDYRSGGGLMGPDPLQLRNDPLKFQKGGKVPGSGPTDSVLSLLTPGEVVISKPAVEKIGVGNLLALNAAVGGTNQGGPFMFEGGGLVGNLQSMRETSQTPPKFSPVKASGMIPVNVPVKPNVRNQTVVLPEITRQKQSQNIREGSTVPVFQITANSSSRNATVVSLGIEDMV